MSAVKKSTPILQQRAKSGEIKKLRFLWLTVYAALTLFGLVMLIGLVGLPGFAWIKRKKRNIQQQNDL